MPEAGGNQVTCICLRRNSLRSKQKTPLATQDLPALGADLTGDEVVFAQARRGSNFVKRFDGINVGSSPQWDGRRQRDNHDCKDSRRTKHHRVVA